MIVYSTSTFRQSLEELCKRPKHAYGSCPSDICEEFRDKRVEDLLTSNSAILIGDSNKCILKIRIKCASRNVGKSGGFRLIAFANRETQEIVLMEVFPKVGSHAKSNISDGELEQLIAEHIKERNDQHLMQLDINENLSIIKPD